jgi:acyl-CoA synthetase (AMP-forming)/AMP-acid ligase II
VTLSASTFSRFSTLVQLLRYRAEHHPEHVACTFLADGETQEFNLTYREWDERARALAVWFQSQAAAGDRALLRYP